MAIDRFTWFGLAVALLGWIVLVADLALSPFLLRADALAAEAALRADIFSVADTTIFTGLGLAIIGVLRTGFGALHRFFGAVLERAGTGRPPAAATLQPAPIAPEPLPAAPAVELEPLPSHDPRRVQAKNYTVLPSGAVEVETLLGTKVFASMDEARDFIR